MAWAVFRVRSKEPAQYARPLILVDVVKAVATEDSVVVRAGSIGSLLPCYRDTRPRFLDQMPIGRNPEGMSGLPDWARRSQPRAVRRRSPELEPRPRIYCKLQFPNDSLRLRSLETRRKAAPAVECLTIGLGGTNAQ
jgi:hypothetical protein